MREVDWLQSVIFPVSVSVGQFVDLLCKGQSAAATTERKREWLQWHRSIFYQQWLSELSNFSQILILHPIVNYCISLIEIHISLCLQQKWDVTFRHVSLLDFCQFWRFALQLQFVILLGESWTVSLKKINIWSCWRIMETYQHHHHTIGKCCQSIKQFFCPWTTFI